MKTPYFLISEKELIDNISCFKEAFQILWPNYKIAYSVKTNSLPWLLDFMKKNDIFAETVSDEEYQLSKLCGYDDKQIIFNGPIKSEEQLKTAFDNFAIINIDSKNEIEYIKNNKPIINGNLGIRINVNTDIFDDNDIGYKEDGFRFGFSEENGEFNNVLAILQDVYSKNDFGLHIHVNTVTRSVNAYKGIAKYTANIIKKYALKPKYIDLGGGFFGGVPGKPTAFDYISAIKEELIDTVNIDETMLIIEPGSAISGSAFDFYTSVIDVKDTEKSRIITTDGSRINIDPLWLKHKYLYLIFDKNNNEIINRSIIKKQLICGYTCMDHDRLMKLENECEIKKEDIIVYHKVGNYTVTFGGMFIRYLPDVYVKKTNGEIKKIRNRTLIEDYYKLHSL